MRFPEFERLTNPTNEKRYVARTTSGISQALNFSEVSNLARTESSLVMEWIIPEGYLILETEELSILPSLIKREEKLLVVRIDSKLYIYTKSTFGNTTINNTLACGITGNTYCKGTSNIILPFKNSKVSKAVELSSVDIYGTDIYETPIWLMPIKKVSSVYGCGITYPINNNELIILTNIASNLKEFKKSAKQEIINIIAEDLCTKPIKDLDIDNILSTSNDVLLAEFFNKNDFLHDKLGDYIIQSCNIKRDAEKNLFYYNSSKNVYVDDESYILGYMTRLCPRLKDFQKQETLKYIKNVLFDDTVEFNSNPYTVVFKNGILNVATNSFMNMNPDHLESIQINCNYVDCSHIKCDIVDEFFATATCGDTDTEQLLYEAIGYAMLKTNELQLAFMLVGNGRNGKSTYLDLVKAVLGKGNYGSISFKDLQSNFRASMLINKLASFAGDVSNQPIQDSELVKSLIAGEEVTLERKYKDATAAQVFSTMFYACNTLPKTPDTTDGFYRRFCIIPFNANLATISKVDGMSFKQKLLSEESLQYVAYKAVKAITTVMNTTKTFTEPKIVEEIKNEYKIAGSSILSWFKENIESDAGKLVVMGSSKAYINYTQWCNECKRTPCSRTTFVTKIATELNIDIEKK